MVKRNRNCCDRNGGSYRRPYRFGTDNTSTGSLFAQDGASPRTVESWRLREEQDRCDRSGKSLFWDMQVGSDGIQSCTTCHFHAEADNRSKNHLWVEATRQKTALLELSLYPYREDLFASSTRRKR